MAGLPAPFLEGVSPAERQAAERWWAGLTDAARAELALSLDPRAESCSFALQGEDLASWRWEPVAVNVDSELLADPEEPDVDWDWDYFEYRLINPDSFPVPPYEVRTFHIGARNGDVKASNGVLTRRAIRWLSIGKPCATGTASSACC
jgi:hypothetical protein